MAIITSRPSMDISLGPSVTVRTNASPQGDVIFLPSNAMGTPGTLNSQILSQLRLEVKLPSERALAAGYCFQNWPGGLICYIVTVGRLPADQALLMYLTHALSTSQLLASKDIWIPLMGTGAAGLSFDRSFILILQALRSSGWLDRMGRHAIIAVPENIPSDDAEALDAAIIQAQKQLSDSVPRDKNAAVDVYALPMAPAVSDALSLAAALAVFPRASRRISSSLLFFALAESSGTAAPPALATDSAADIFSSAVQELARERYSQAWNEYFKSTERPSRIGNTKLPQPTKNVAAILQTAAATATSKGAAMIGIDHVIYALLTKQETRLLDVLSQIGVRPEVLLKEYADARLGQIRMTFRNDVATDVDRLGYDGYATAIVNFLTHAETPPPLSISIQAPWGGGKSSLMNLVREKLDPKIIREKHKPNVIKQSDIKHLLLGNVLKLLDQNQPFTIEPDTERSLLWTVWFNAWKYETSEQIWAGLVDAIVSQIGDRLPLIEREKFFLKLHLSRIDDGVVRRKIYNRIANIWWSKVRAWALSGAGLLASPLRAQVCGSYTLRPQLHDCEDVAAGRHHPGANRPLYLSGRHLFLESREPA